MIIRRILGAAMRTLPLLALLFIPLLFALPRLYPWARPLGDVPDKNLRQHLQNITHSYLNVHGFIIRAIIYFAIWGTLIFLLTKWSKEQDRPPVRDNSARFKVLSGPGIILYGFTISFAAIDWTMSLDPSWISTIYPLIILIGEVLSALCFAVVIERILFRYRPMSELLKPEYVHDHGKFMLTFIMVWAYFSFSQWLIIWAGNLPEEITWYTKRLNGDCGWRISAAISHPCHWCPHMTYSQRKYCNRRTRRFSDGGRTAKQSTSRERWIRARRHGRAQCVRVPDRAGAHWRVGAFRGQGHVRFHGLLR